MLPELQVSLHRVLVCLDRSDQSQWLLFHVAYVPPPTYRCIFVKQIVIKRTRVLREAPSNSNHLSFEKPKSPSLTVFNGILCISTGRCRLPAHAYLYVCTWNSEAVSIWMSITSRATWQALLNTSSEPESRAEFRDWDSHLIFFNRSVWSLNKVVFSKILVCVDIKYRGTDMIYTAVCNSFGRRPNFKSRDGF